MPNDEPNPLAAPKAKGKKANKVLFGEIPDDLSAFGGEVPQEGYVQGWAVTENIPALLEAVGLELPKHYSFPFHRMERRHGELWSFRIEEAHTHMMEGGLVMAHHWVYKREQPETVAGAA